MTDIWESTEAFEALKSRRFLAKEEYSTQTAGMVGNDVEHGGSAERATSTPQPPPSVAPSKGARATDKIVGSDGDSWSNALLKEISLPSRWVQGSITPVTPGRWVQFGRILWCTAGGFVDVVVLLEFIFINVYSKYTFNLLSSCSERVTRNDKSRTLGFDSA